MACCGGPNFSAYEGLDDDYSVVLTDSGDSSESKPLETTFEKATPLFREIDRENWEAVLLFLKKGKWAGSFFSSSTIHLEAADPATQARTWVVEGDYRQLPIHAAASQNAPFVVLQKLMEAYPESVKLRDSLGHLPLHIAYGTGSPDTTVLSLLEAWPQAALEKNKRGSRPHQASGDTARGKIMTLTLDQMAANAAKDYSKEWKPLVQAESEALRMEVKEDTTLSEVLKQLMEDRKQLIQIKSQLKNNFNAHSSRGSRSKSGSSGNKSSGLFPRQAAENGSKLESAFSKHKSRKGQTKKKSDNKNDWDLRTFLSAATEPQKNPRLSTQNHKAAAAQ